MLNVAKAVEWNPHYSRTTNPPWKNRYDQVITELGFNSMSPGPELFAQAVYDWQLSNGVSGADGILGPNSWKKLEPQTRYSIDLGSPPPSWLNKPKPKSKKKKSKPDTAESKQDDIGELTRLEIIDELMSEANLPKKTAGTLADIMLGLKVARTSVILGEILGIYATWGVTVVSAQVGGILLMPFGFALALMNASTTNYRLVGRIAYAWTYTAWVYGLPSRMPSELKRRLKKSGVAMEASGAAAWQKYSQNMFRDAPKHGRKLKLREGFGGIQGDTHRAMLQLISNGDPDKLFQTLLSGIRINLAGTEEGKMFSRSCDGLVFWPNKYTFKRQAKNK